MSLHRVGPHTLRRAFITAALDAGIPLRDVQETASHADPRTTMRYDGGRVSLDRHATYIVAALSLAQSADERPAFGRLIMRVAERRSRRSAPAPGPGLTAANSGTMALDPLQPYGPLVESSFRIVTWNVWGRNGEWRQRQAALEAALVNCQPDVVCLAESWSAQEATQAEAIAGRLGVPHSLFVGDWKEVGWTSGIGVVSRWPIARHEERPLPSDDGDAAGTVLFAAIDGPRGLLQVFVAMLDYPLDASARRQAQVRQLCEFVADAASRRHVTVVCGDFNAHPDSDEIRMLTGRAACPVPGLVFYDAWEVAGDGSPGITWSNKNPLAAIGRYPDRRFDYVFSAWPRAGAAGHPTHCELVGVAPEDGAQISDHYGVLADVRY